MATIRGTLASATLQEMFVHSFAIVSSRQQDTIAANMSTLWQECLNVGGGAPLKGTFPASTIYNEVTVAQILSAEPPDPRLAAASHVYFTPITGTSSGNALPSQCAIAVSVKAGTRPNGTPAKGRFYLPGPGTGRLNVEDGTLQDNDRNKISTAIQDFWSKMNLAGDKPALWSRTRGTVTPWDAIRVGNKVDTIRRRRNELPEAYTLYVSVPA